MDVVESFEDEVRSIRLTTRITRALGYGVHVYRVGPCLIDAGFRHARRRLLSWPDLSAIDVCLLTHYHEDHTGNAAELARRSVGVRAPAPVADRVRRPRGLRLYQRLMWGAAEPVVADPLGDTLEAPGLRLVPIATPGHSPDHHIYYEEQRGLAFTGDLYLGRRVELARPEEEIGVLVESLRKVRALEPRAIFCAHRGRVDRPVQALTEKIDWLEELIGRVAELAAAGAGARDIRRRLLGREPFVYWFTGGDLGRGHLVESALRGRSGSER